MSQEDKYKICTKCSKQMIKTGTGIVLTSYPPQYPQKWWCGCGHEEPAETIWGTTVEESNRNEWNRLN
jgi:hypothetical protein